LPLRTATRYYLIALPGAVIHELFPIIRYSRLHNLHALYSKDLVCLEICFSMDGSIIPLMSVFVVAHRFLMTALQAVDDRFEDPLPARAFIGNCGCGAASHAGRAAGKPSADVGAVLCAFWRNAVTGVAAAEYAPDELPDSGPAVSWRCKGYGGSTLKRRTNPCAKGQTT